MYLDKSVKFPLEKTYKILQEVGVAFLFSGALTVYGSSMRHLGNLLLNTKNRYGHVSTQIIKKKKFNCLFIYLVCRCVLFAI